MILHKDNDAAILATLNAIGHLDLHHQSTLAALAKLVLDNENVRHLR